ncbi:MAG: pseudouridine synthase [Bacteroidales bacterium]|jgi:23S rRNA pseudouridine2605 synthase|nr:pseudouridine synthase [Bacteroidales bacterium]
MKKSEKNQDNQETTSKRVTKTRKRSFEDFKDTDKPKRTSANSTRGTVSRSERPYREKRSFDKEGSENRYRGRDRDNTARPEKPYREKRSFDKEGSENRYRGRDRDNTARPEIPYREKRSFDIEGCDNPYRARDRDNTARPERPYREKRSFDREGSENHYRERDRDNTARPERPYGRDRGSFSRSERPARTKRSFDGDKKKRRDITAESPILSEIVERRRREGRLSPQRQKILSLEHDELHGTIRLNKYIANAGICSRREADTLITTGAVTVNGQIVTELGTKVQPTDEVRYGDKVLQREKPVYILLNKPKDYITTTYDDRERKDVMELIRGACEERVYPVGRLDKNTTGVLLFTNDGEMAKKLTHPKHGVRKTYAVELDKNLSGSDFDAILQGIELSDGLIQVDELSYINDSKREVGLTIHSGRNRIVRRIFEHLGYEIVKLDRAIFAGLDKKKLPRGKWRFLSPAEINILKMI